MRAIGVIICSVLVSGCLPEGNFKITETSSPNSFSVPTIVSGNCGASGLQHLLNQGESALAAVELPAETRIIRPGTAYTADAVGSRLNIGISADGTIVHVACG